MEERKLEVLKFNITPKGEASKFINMSSISGADLMTTFFADFIPYIEDLEPDEKNKRIVKVGSHFSKHEMIRSITGIIETGNYGKEENVVDITQKPDSPPVFKIHKNHSVQKPFFFLICIPVLKNEGIIILERVGQYGIKSIFTYMVQAFVSHKFPEYKAHFSPFIDDQVVENYIKKGQYNSISLTRHSLPGDIADRYGLGNFETHDFVVELTIKAKGKKAITGNAKRRILKLFESSYGGFFTSEDFSNLGFDDSAKIKVNATYNQSKRTIDLSDTMKFRPYYDITVALSASGHSDFNSINTEAIRLLKDLNLELF